MEELKKEVQNKTLVPKKEIAIVKENEISQKSNINLQGLQEEFLKKQVESGKSLNEITNDFAKAKVTSNIINGQSKETDKLNSELAKEQKETIKESFKADKFVQQAKSISAKQQKAEAFYISFRPILEFDFSALIHKKEKEDYQQKEYKDRSYGIFLMVLMLILFVVPYCLFCIVLAVFNGINAISEAIATFGKIARVIATTIFIVFIITLIIYCGLLGIDKLFGTEIIKSFNLK